MKTRLIITLFAVFALLLSAGFASAGAVAIPESETTDINADNTNGITVNVTTSKNVVGAWNSSDTSYALGMYHVNGTREYGTGSAVGGIFYQTCTNGDPCASETINADDNSAEAFGTGWTKM